MSSQWTYKGSACHPEGESALQTPRFGHNLPVSGLDNLRARCLPFQLMAVFLAPSKTEHWFSVTCHCQGRPTHHHRKLIGHILERHIVSVEVVVVCCAVWSVGSVGRGASVCVDIPCCVRMSDFTMMSTSSNLMSRSHAIRLRQTHSAVDVHGATVLKHHSRRSFSFLLCRPPTVCL